MSYSFVYGGIAPPTAGHIHIGPVGTTGIVVVGFFAAPTGLPASVTGIAGQVAADPAVIKQIDRNPSNYYLNLHNVDFPTGAIRGQLSRNR